MGENDPLSVRTLLSGSGAWVPHSVGLSGSLDWKCQWDGFGAGAVEWEGREVLDQCLSAVLLRCHSAGR